MTKFFALIFAVSTLMLAGCSSLQYASKKSAIETALVQRAKVKVESEHGGLMSDQRVAELMAIDVQKCPADFRSAWFDYLTEVQNLHIRVERVALIASAEGKAVGGLPALIKLAVANPTLGQYLLTSLNRVDDARAKLERTAMNYGVMPRR